MNKPLYNNIFESLNKESKTGKEYSLYFEKNEPDFAKYLRLNYYYIKLTNEDISIIKTSWKENL